jgi:hypothetical protein
LLTQAVSRSACRDEQVRAAIDRAYPVYCVPDCLTRVHPSSFTCPAMGAAAESVSLPHARRPSTPASMLPCPSPCGGPFLEKVAALAIGRTNADSTIEPRVVAPDIIRNRDTFD